MTNVKKYAIFGSAFAIFALVFSVVYLTGIVKFFDFYLAATYVTYFVGLSLIYISLYERSKKRNASCKISMFFAVLFCVAAIALLIYGLISGHISIISF